MTGNGTAANPYQVTTIPDPAGCLINTPAGIAIDLDPASPAPITCGVDGLSVACCPPCVIDSDTIDFEIVVVDGVACITGEVLTAPAGGGGVFFTGMVVDFALSEAFVPAGWLPNNGDPVTVASGNIALRNALIADGSPYGNDGTDPLRPGKEGRVSVGAGTGAGLTPRALGDSFGVEAVTLTGAESGVAAHGHGVTDPTHTHPVTGHTDYDHIETGNIPLTGTDTYVTGLNATGALSAALEDGLASAASTGVTVDNAVAANAADAHENMQPSLVFTSIIKT